MKKLTDRQIKFAEEYLLDFNAKRAAIAAGYSKKTAENIASENLKKKEIQKYINELQQKRKEKYELDENRIIRELMNIAFARMSDYAKIDSAIDYVTRISMQNSKF